MIKQDKPTDFHISVKPVSIEFECPHCHAEIEIRWNDLLVPDYWGDDWGEVDCPECEKPVRLGGYDYDCPHLPHLPLVRPIRGRVLQRGQRV